MKKTFSQRREKFVTKTFALPNKKPVTPPLNKHLNSSLINSIHNFLKEGQMANCHTLGVQNSSKIRLLSIVPSEHLVPTSTGAPELFKVSSVQAPTNSSSSGSFSSSSFYSLTRSGSRAKSRRKKSSKIFPHCLKPFLKYFIREEKMKKISVKRSTKTQIIEDQIPDLLETKAHPFSSLSSF